MKAGRDQVASLPHLSSKKKFISTVPRRGSPVGAAHALELRSRCSTSESATARSSSSCEFVDGANLKAIIEHIKKTAETPRSRPPSTSRSRSARASRTRHELTRLSLNGVPASTSCTATCRRPTCSTTKYGEEDRGLGLRRQQPAREERAGHHQGQQPYRRGRDGPDRRRADRDIFAVGIILWELLAGQRLFFGDTDFQTVKKVQAAQVPSTGRSTRRCRRSLNASSTRRSRASRRSRTHARELGLELSAASVQVRRAW